MLMVFHAFSVFAPVLLCSSCMSSCVNNSLGKTRVCGEHMATMWWKLIWMTFWCLPCFFVFAHVLFYALACHRNVTTSLGKSGYVEQTYGGDVRNDSLKIWDFRDDEEFEGASDGSLEWVGKSCSHPARSSGTFFIPHRSQRTASWRSCPAMQRCLNLKPQILFNELSSLCFERWSLTAVFFAVLCKILVIGEDCKQTNEASTPLCNSNPRLLGCKSDSRK